MESIIKSGRICISHSLQMLCHLLQSVSGLGDQSWQETI